MTAQAPGRGTLDWRWDPEHGAWVAVVSDLAPNTTAGAVERLWQDGRRLLRLAKAKGGRPRGSGRVPDLPAGLAEYVADRDARLAAWLPHQRQNVVLQTPTQKEVAAFLGIRVRRLQELWKEQGPDFLSWDAWLEENDLKGE